MEAPPPRPFVVPGEVEAMLGSGFGDSLAEAAWEAVGADDPPCGEVVGDASTVGETVGRGVGVTAEGGVGFGVGFGVGWGVGTGVSLTSGVGTGVSLTSGVGVSLTSGVGVSLTGSEGIAFAVLAVFSPLPMPLLAPNE
jgi:hypothetical protein